VECPSDTFPENVKRPNVEVLTLSLEEANPENPSIFNQIFGLEDELTNANLDLVVTRGIFTKIVMGDDTTTDSFFFRCPKLLSELEAFG